MLSQELGALAHQVEESVYERGRGWPQEQGHMTSAVQSGGKELNWG